MRFELILEDSLADGRVIVTNSSAYAYSPGAEKTALAMSGGFDVPRGTEFTELIYKPSDSENVISGESLRSQCVSLRVAEVNWFRRSIEVVPNGHHAAVRLIGVGLDLVHNALATKSNGVRFFLVGNETGT